MPPKDLSPSKINDGAIETYQRLVTEFPISVYKDYAEARIAALKTGTAQDFYAWFEQQNPKPADREMPKDLIPPSPDETKTATGTPIKNRAASRHEQARFRQSGRRKEACRGQPGQVHGARAREQEAGDRRRSGDAGSRVSNQVMPAQRRAGMTSPE